MDPAKILGHPNADNRTILPFLDESHRRLSLLLPFAVYHLLPLH
jgi:hypothetical protein